LTKFERNHRLVQEIEQEIQQAKSAITAEMLTPLRDETTDRNANYEWAKGERQKAQVEMEGLDARRRTQSEQLAGYRTLARQLGEDAILQDDLISTEKAAQENYLLYVKKREQARMGDALDEGGIVNVAIAEQPVVPTLPVWPAAAVLLVGFVAALTTGAGGAFAADYLDPALRTPEEALSCLEIPVLASIPEGIGKRLSLMEMK
jgi:uncharacterized protein involved in exopolysaccharide biosynthesis